MSTCKECGAEMQEGAKFCSVCGTPSELKNEDKFGANNGQQFGANNGQQFGANNNQFVNGAAQFQQKEGTAEYYGKQPYTPPAEDAEANKGVAICAYFGLLWLVPLFTTAKHSPFAKFHTNQAIVITIVCAVVELMTTIFDAILDAITWKFYVLTSIVSYAGDIFCLTLIIWGIVYAAQGKMKEIPVIGQIRIIK